jgi:hypothetical protein
MPLMVLGCNLNSKPNNAPVSIQFDRSIEGIWTDGAAPYASFSIKGDSIYYVDHSPNARFTQHGDSSTFYYPDFTITARVYKIHDDTLIIESYGESAKYWRFPD